MLSARSEEVHIGAVICCRLWLTFQGFFQHAPQRFVYQTRVPHQRLTI